MIRNLMASTKLAWSVALIVVAISTAAGVFLWKRVIMAPWDEEFAYTKGLQAVVYSFPYVLNSSLRYVWSQPAKEGERITGPVDAVNQFWHSPELATAKYRDGGGPNNDTLYSTAWVFADKEPMVISVPDIGTVPGTDKPRYFSLHIGAFDSDNIGYIGTRTTGNQAGHYAIIPKGWNGKLPDNVKQVGESPTPWFLIVGRTMVNGPDDVPAVAALMKQYKMRTLSDFISGVDRRPPAPPIPPAPHYLKEQTQLLSQFWSIANAAMTENPPNAIDKRLVDAFAEIEVGPGRDLSKLSDGMRRGLERAALRGLPMLREVNKSDYEKKVINGWKYPPTYYGRAGAQGAFLTRAALQSLGGIIVHDPEEAVYVIGSRDAAGDRLDGSSNYRITFPKGKLPPAKSFWSVTLYDDTLNLVENSIDRYSLGDRTPGLVFNDDGSMSFYIGYAPPKNGPQSNWLPAPKGQFFLVMRIYIPGQEVVEQRWEPPGIEKL